MWGPRLACRWCAVLAHTYNGVEHEHMRMRLQSAALAYAGGHSHIHRETGDCMYVF